MAILLDQITIGDIKILVLDANPATGGYAAAIGSLAVVSGEAGIYQKSGILDADWTTSSVNPEDVQDIIAGMLQDSSTIDFNYDDLAGTLTAAIKALSITNAEISALAAIDATKIHDGSVDNTEFGYLNGVTSPIQTQLNDLDAMFDNYIPTSEKGAALGVATLDAAGKVPLAQLPSAIMEYKGVWNAATNTPVLSDFVDGAAAGDAIGNVYRVSVAGTQDLGSGPISFEVGDYAILNANGKWEKSDTTDAVASVNGFTGVVVLDTDDVSEGSTNLYFTDARAKTAAVADTILDGITDVAPSQNAVFDALALKIDSSEKGQPNGVATLDATGKVPSAQLPSYVDDVLEYANLAAFPVTGETGKIYVALDTNKTYRWSGSVYIEISASEVNSVNGQTGVVVLDTDDIAEGSTNLYFTDARAKAATVADVITDGVVDVAPSQNAVFDALALKVDKAGDTMTGDLNMSGNDLLQVGTLGIGTATPDTVLHVEENGVKYNVSAAATQTVGAVNGAASIVAIDTDTVMLLKVMVTGREAATGLSVAYERTVKAKNVAGTVSLGAIQSDYTDEDQGMNQANCTFAVNAANVEVRVTGITAKTIDWKCVVTKVR